MHQSFAQIRASLPYEDQVEINRIIWMYRGLGLGLPLAAFVWSLSRHGLLTAIDLLLHPATLFAGAAFYLLVPMVFGLMLTGTQAVAYWNARRADGVADTDVGH